MDGTAVSNMALKMPRCQVMLQTIDVQREKTKLRDFEVKHRGVMRAFGDTNQVEVANKRKTRSAKINGINEDCYLELHSGTGSDEDPITGSDEDDEGINALSKHSNTSIVVSKDLSNNDVREERVTRQRVKQSDGVSPQTEVAPVRLSSTFSKSGVGFESQPSKVKYKSAKTGRVFEKHPCDLCDKVFSSSVGLNFHMASHVLECKVCNLTFGNSQLLKTHSEKHIITTLVVNKSQILCTVCCKEFSTQKLLKKHMATVNIHTRPYSCSLETCERTFNKLAHLLNHRQMHPDTREKECEKCAMKFSSESSLSQHRKIHNCGKDCKVPISDPEERYECSECQKCFSKSEYLELHEDNHWESQAEYLPCRIPTCLLTFSLKQKLDKHMEEHTTFVSDGILSCSRRGCHERFRDPMLLKKHLENHTTVETCRICGLTFITKLDLLLHRVVCINERETKQSRLGCNLCGKIFKAERFLANHIKLCGKNDHNEEGARGHGRHLTNHMHNGVPGDLLNISELSPPILPNLFNAKSLYLEILNDAKFYDAMADVSGSFKCKHSDCDKKFTLRSALRTHYMSHHDLDMACTECGQHFKSRTNLTKHRMSQHNLSCTPTHCPFCDDSFPSLQNLQIHILSAHPTPWTCVRPGCFFRPTFLLEATMHMQSHEVRSCDWPACGKSFPDRDALMEHMQSHTETLLSCPVQSCLFICCMADKFQNHLEQQHQQEKLFNCHPCSYYSYNMRQLECHLESGHRQRPKPHEFSCEVNISCGVQGCTASFVQEAWLLKHLRTVHRQVGEIVSAPVGIHGKDAGDDAISAEYATDKEIVVGEHLIVKESSVYNCDANGSGYEAHTSKNVENQEKHDNESVVSVPPCQPKLDNDLLYSYTPGRDPGPPLASSQQVEISTTEDSVVIVEISEDLFSHVDIVPPVTKKIDDKKDTTPVVDDENNEKPDILLSEEDVIIEEVTDAKDDSEDYGQSFDVECFDSQVLNTELVEEQEAFVDVSEALKKSAERDISEGCLTGDGTVEKAVKKYPELKKCALVTLYSSVVSGSPCPVTGVFIRALNITQDMLERMVIPDLLEPVDSNSSLCKGLAIDLLELQQETSISQDVLASYVSQLLPVSERPSLPDPAMVGHMVDVLTKMKVQATRFRVKYSTFPRYLDKYLVELCNPFM